MSSSIIGGMFGLEVASHPVASARETWPLALRAPHLLLVTARSALALLASKLAPATVWLPSFLCPAIVTAFASGAARLRFYGVDTRFHVSEEGWEKDVQPGDLVLFIDYFGFNRWCDCGARVRARGAWVVEDACQAMLNSSFCRHAHFVVCSPRKFAGVPDGGILIAQAGAEIMETSLPPPPLPWWLRAVAASCLRSEFDRHGGARDWFELYQEAESGAPLDICRASDLCEALLKHGIAWPEIARRRRENFTLLASHLSDWACFTEIPENVVPLGFPVRVRERDHVRQALFSRGIYPPVHWEILGTTPASFVESHRLASEIMTLPCDQRYDAADMTRLADEFRQEALS